MNVLASCSLLLSFVSCSPQGPGKLELDAHALAAPSAVLDPSGALDLSAEGRGWRVHFGALDIPPPGVLKIGMARTATEIQVSLVDGKRQLSALSGGELKLESLTPARASGTIDYAAEGARHRLVFDLAPALRPLAEPKIERAKPVPAFPPPKDKPNPDDLVFCAIGNQGTGLPGQKLVAESVAKLAATGPLDFVILLGDNFPPRGVASVSDPQWRTKFAEVYDPKRLAVPFYAVAGEADWLGNDKVFCEFGKIDQRWTGSTAMRAGSDFEIQSHGKTFGFFPADTTRLAGEIPDARTRVAQRAVVHRIQPSKADWKIVFGHTPLRSSGPAKGSHRVEKVVAILESLLEQFKTDLWICADDPVLQLFAPKNGVTQVTSGGGGGPEMAGSATWSDDTVFAATGGGFTWFRFDGEKLEISFRDARGNVLYVHTIKK